MSWTDADIAPASEAWSDADVVAPVKKNMLQKAGDMLQRHVVGPAKNIAEVVIEPALAIGTGAVGQLAGNFAGAAGDIYSRAKGTVNIGGDVQRDVSSALTYQPRNPMARAVLEGAGKAFDESKLAGLPVVGNEMQVIGSGLPNAAIVARSAVAPDAAKTAALVRESGNNSRRLANIATAQRAGLTLNPAEVNPSSVNKVGAALVGDPALNEGAFIKNQPVVNSIARRELGIPEGTALGPDSYKAVIEKASKPYEEISAIPKFTTDAQFSGNLNKRSFLTNLPEGEQALLKNSKKVDALVEAANLPEFTGKGAVEIMKQYRSDANAILNNPNAKPAQIALANAQRNIAKQIEAMIDRNLVAMDATNPGQGFGDLAQRFREGRTTIAKAKTLEKVTDADGNIIATKLKGDKNNTSYTGGLKDINDVANSFPEAFTPPTTSNPQLNVSLGGRLNKALDIASTPVRKAMLSDWYQGKNAAGLDARDLRTRMGYSPIETKQPLTLGEGALPPQGMTGQTFGVGPKENPLLQIGDQGPLNAPRTPREMPVVDIPIDPRLNPLYQRGGVPQGPQVPSAAPQQSALYPGGIPYSTSELPPVAPVPAQRPAPLPAIAEELLPEAQWYPQGIPLGAANGAVPPASTPLPKLYPDPRPTMELLEPQAVAQALRQPEGNVINFPLKTEVLQQPEMVQAIDAFRFQAQQLKEAIAAETNGFKRSQLEATLRGVENRFAKGAHLLGGEQAADFYGPNYQSGTRFGIERTFDPRDMAAQLRKQQ